MGKWLYLSYSGGTQEQVHSRPVLAVGNQLADLKLLKDSVLLNQCNSLWLLNSLISINNYPLLKKHRGIHRIHLEHLHLVHFIYLANQQFLWTLFLCLTFILPCCYFKESHCLSSLTPWDNSLPWTSIFQELVQDKHSLFTNAVSLDSFFLSCPFGPYNPSLFFSFKCFSLFQRTCLFSCLSTFYFFSILTPNIGISSYSGFS